MNLTEWIWSLVSVLLTVMVLSYLVGDNAFFRLAVHLFIGITAGYMTVLLINQIIMPYLLQPLFSGIGYEVLWVFIPLVLSILLLLSQVPRFTGLGRIPLAYLAGLTAAIAIGGAVFGTIIPQTGAVIDTFDSGFWYSVPEMTWSRILDAGVMLIGTISTLSYFHFGRKINNAKDADATQRPRLFEISSKVGQVFIGITLGAVFVGVFSTALIALIDRLLVIGQFISRLLGGV